MFQYSAVFNPITGKVELTTQMNVTGKNHSDPAIRTSKISYTIDEIHLRIRVLEKNRKELGEAIYEKVMLPYTTCLNCFGYNQIFTMPLAVTSIHSF